MRMDCFRRIQPLPLFWRLRLKCFGLTMDLGGNHPEQMIFHAYYNDELQESYSVTVLEALSVISHEFTEFDRLMAS